MLLAKKRDMMLYKADMSRTFLCTSDGVPQGIWVSLEEAGRIGREKTLKEIDEVLVKLV